MSQYRDDFRSVQGEAYWSLPRIFLFILFLVALGTAVDFTGNAIGLWEFKFWAPKVENAKREVFENTQSYVQGKTEYLSKLRYQYQEAESNSPHKAALRSLILSEASTVDNSKLPADLQGFIVALKGL